jgi:uncharacterized membrane protein YqjE
VARPDSGADAAPGVIASLRSLAANAVGIVRTRLELLANELEEERVRTLEILVLGAVALFCAAFGLVLLTAWLVVALWEQYRLFTLGVLALAYLVAAGVTLGVLKSKARERSKIFSASLAELRRDRDVLEP